MPGVWIINIGMSPSKIYFKEVVGHYFRYFDSKIDGYDGEIFNIGANKELSVLEITDIILKTLNKGKELINHIKDRPGHVKRHAVNTNKINTILDWKPDYDFKTAMVETINWYVNNDGWWRKIKYQDENFKSFYKLNYEENKN